MMVRYVTPTGRLGRILADTAIRIARINENNDRTLSRVGALLISLSRHEIVCLLGRGEASSYQFCLQARRGSSGVVGPTTPQPTARGPQIPIAPARRTAVPSRPAVSSPEAYQTPALRTRRTVRQRAGI